MESFFEASANMLFCLGCRLLRWGTSTAADAARLEQDYLQHHCDTQVQMSLANSHSRPEQASPSLALQRHAGSETAASNPLQLLQVPQVMQNKQQPDLLKVKDKGIRGILSFAYTPSSKVAPEDAMLSVIKPGQQKDDVILATSAETYRPVRTRQLGHKTHGGTSIAICDAQWLPKAARHGSHRQLSLRAALQQSMRQVKASISHLEWLSMQQQAMQEVLKSLSVNCHVIHDYILQLQQPKTGT